MFHLIISLTYNKKKKTLIVMHLYVQTIRIKTEKEYIKKCIVMVNVNYIFLTTQCGI